MSEQIELGREVRDKVSGFTGIASGRSTYLSGCAHICISPKVGKDRKLPESKWIDEPQVEYTKTKTKKVTIKSNRRLGGPQSHSRY